MPSQPRDRYVGTRIREYEILDVIGKGGMGAVYRARHIYLDHERAIKVIHSEYARDDAFVQRFIREAKMLAKLNHPNLVQLYEFGMLEQDVFFMVMELITGESLLDRVNRLGKLPIDQATKIVREAAEGLHAAHQKNIVHRDISPDNLLIVKEQDGTEITKVIDFGIAKPLEDQTRIYTKTNMFLGKPEYCSPEQCGNLEEGEVIDHRSDIYSLGITLYYALTGKLPFYSSTAAGYLVKHVSEMPKSISIHFPQGAFPPQLEKIIAKSLEKKRDQRYSTMKEFADALNSYKAAGTATPVGGARAVKKLGPGAVFERRYTIEKVMRTSSRGTFYKAVDTILNQPIILKILSKEPQEDAKAKQRLKRTLLLSRKVHHPNVCSLYDIGETEDSLFLTMQYIEGKLLSDFIQESRTIAPDIAIQITKDLTSAISELHSKGIIHRNLKTRNVMIDPENHAHIFDFANARSLVDPGKTEVSQSFDASPFTAPETFTNQPIDERSDIYALGVILFQLTTGALPYKGDSLPSIIFAIMNRPPVKPSEVRPGINPDLEKIILKAIDKDPEQRYRTAEELLKAIESFETRPAAGVPEVRESQASTEEAKKLFEEGKELYNELRLEEAISVWRRAAELRPGDDMIHKCLMAAENRLKRENQIRDEVKLLFAQCEAHLQQKEFDQAKKILDLCDKKITSSPRFREQRDYIYALWKKMDVKAERKPTEKYNSDPFQAKKS